jgi:hypothetical protein
MTLRPCESGLDNKIKMKVVSKVFDHHEGTGKFVNKHFEILSWIFIILLTISTIVVAQGLYNVYLFGTCDPVHPEQCIINGVVDPQPDC